MRTTSATKTKLSSRSLTETILSLCASGRFGVREAIAEASQKKSQKKREEQRARAQRKAA
jgi:hypothetical protein